MPSHAPVICAMPTVKESLLPSEHPLDQLGHAVASAAAAASADRRIVVNEVAALTGVSRERLRTWERRHGFPVPQRLSSNMRTYAISDLPSIVGVARLIETGYPVGDAISAILRRGEPAASLEAGEVSLDHAPMPGLALRPEADRTLAVVWVNTATRIQPGSLAPGDAGDTVEARIGSDATAEIRTLAAGTGEDAPQLLEHRDWVGTLPVIRHSLAWGTDTDAGRTVVLLQVPEALSATDAIPAKDREAARWAMASAAARAVLQRERGLASAQHALRELAEHAGAFDGLLALRHGSEVRTASSVRGMVAARNLAAGRGADLLAAIDGGELRWLDPASAAIFDLPTYLRLLAIPLSIGGRRLGVALLSFPQRYAIPAVAEELLDAFGVAAAASIERDRGPGAR